MLWIRIRISLATLDPDPHWFGYLDPDPDWFGYLDLDPDPLKPSPLHEVCPDFRPEPVAEHEPDTVLALVLALRRVQQVSKEEIIQSIKADKNDPQKVKKFHVLNCWMFSFEG